MSSDRPSRRACANKHRAGYYRAGVLVLLATMTTPCIAVEAPADDENGDAVFTLGQITVTARRPARESPGDTRIDAAEMFRFDTPSLDQAVKLVPGVAATFDANGRRNERDIFVRGFGRLQVPLSIDGIRIYLPADNRLDFNRFLTPDLAEIQIQKGYVPVVDGPGGLGGAINLVTRKPTRRFESQFQGGTAFGRDAAYEGWNGFARVGTRLERFYAQASVAYHDRERWSLSDDFTPTSIENGGAREQSASRDSRINVKLGVLPRGEDEYTLSYTRQDGRKSAPLHVGNDPPVPPNSYWTWPWWDIENLYFLSSTAIGESGFVKTRLFHNRFENALYAWDDGSYRSQSLNGRFQSFYDDEGYGGSLELGRTLGARHSARISAHFRRDEHVEYNVNRPTSAAFRSVEPRQSTKQETASIAVEDVFRASEALEFKLGASYERNEVLVVQEFTAARGLFANPTGSTDSLNGQLALSWSYSDAAALGFAVSSRARFPTLFERYSTRFGTAVPNPSLSSERALSAELSWELRAGERMRASAAAFWADVSDMIQTVVVATAPVQLTQARNVGDGRNYGLELSADLQLDERLQLGGHYTWLERDVEDPLQPSLRPVGTPNHQAFVFLTWTPLPALSITPSVELASDRWSDVTGGTYRRTGSHALFNVQLQWRASESVVAAIGGRNLGDENYELADGFPEPGRTLYAKLQLTF